MQLHSALNTLFLVAILMIQIGLLPKFTDKEADSGAERPVAGDQGSSDVGQYCAAADRQLPADLLGDKIDQLDELQGRLADRLTDFDDLVQRWESAAGAGVTREQPLAEPPSQALEYGMSLFEMLSDGAMQEADFRDELTQLRSRASGHDEALLMIEYSKAINSGVITEDFFAAETREAGWK